MPSALETESLKWLNDYALPLWLQKGVDRPSGGFFEALNLTTGEPEILPRRAMVQARQIYSLRVALELGISSADQLRPAIIEGARHLLKDYQLPTGAFIHSITPEREPYNSVPELYTQAFALFGLAHAFAIEPATDFKNAALKLVEYLSRERRVAAGGFTELQNGEVVYQSNPHMHLFEAALSWLETDDDPTWKWLADETLELCLTRFIDADTGLLAENFDSKWQIQEENGRFFFEPGHQYEWSWLMGRYQNLTGRDLTAVRLSLFANAEKAERDRTHKYVYDQVWSDFSIKSRTARFWPQCERIKCASQLALSLSDAERRRELNFTEAADEAMGALLQYFNTPLRGLWYDILEAPGKFKSQPAKASSLYHIIGAIAEFEKLRS